MVTRRMVYVCIAIDRYGGICVMEEHREQKILMKCIRLVFLTAKRTRHVYRLAPLRVGNFLICLIPLGGTDGAAPMVNSVPPLDGTAGVVDAAPKGFDGPPNPPPKPVLATEGRLVLPVAGEAG